MQSVQRLWGEKFIKVWYNKSHAAGRFPYNDKNEGMHMANGIIFLVGALIMFYMALRSVRQRRSLCTNGEKVQARITGTVQSRDGTAYVLEFTTAGGSHRLQYPKPSRSKNFAEGSVVTLYYDPEAPEKMYVDGDKSVLGAEALYAGELDRARAIWEEAQPLLGALLPHEEIDETGLLFERLAAAHDGTDDENLLDRAELLAQLRHLPEVQRPTLKNLF